jgi:hypothetical protein
MEPIGFTKIADYYVIHSPKYYVASFFRDFASVSIYYLLIIFIEKWSVKNDVK